MIARVLLLLCLATSLAAADPGDSADSLRAANDAASSGDWQRVNALVQPLLAQQLGRADLAEAHRLAGIAALYAQPPRKDIAEAHFFTYLQLDYDGHLDPALYPPEVVGFFNDVRARHAAELKAARPKKRYMALNFLPPFGQFQNGERTKGFVIGGLLATTLIANVTSYALQRSWCTHVERDYASQVCDGHVDGARIARSIQITSGIGFLVTYVYGVYDGIRGYRRESRERALMPYANPVNAGGVVGVRMKF